MTEIHLTTFGAVSAHAEFVALCAEYGQESGNPSVGETMAQGELYRHMEQSGVWRVIEAVESDALIGFAGVLVSPSPHYGGQLVASLESIFVAAAKRKTGAGLALLRAAEQLATDCDCVAMTASAPIGGRLERVLPKQGYTAFNVFLTKPL